MKTEKVYIEYLVLKVQAGERLAAESQVGDELFKVLLPKIKAFVLKISPQTSGVDDCVQDTLLRVMSRLHQLHHVKAFHTWLYRIAYSCCMDAARTKSQIKAVKGAVEQADAGDEPTSKTAHQSDQGLDVNAAIAHLSLSRQAIIYLFYYEGFSITEMSGILKKPAGTIKYDLFQAREQIRQQLTKP